MRKHKGFTLVEILIVVVILGILAAIVIPQFSDASTQSKLSSSQSSLQSLRSQISLYKIQHNDNPPCHGAFDATEFANRMTQYSDVSGTTAAAKNAAANPPIIYGPYVQSIPANPWNNSRTVALAAGDGVGWVYVQGTGEMYLNTTGANISADALATLTSAGAVAP